MILLVESNPSYHARLIKLLKEIDIPAVETGPFCHWAPGLWLTIEEHAEGIIQQIKLSFDSSTPPSLILLELYLRGTEKDYGPNGPQYTLLSVKIATYIANNYGDNIPIMFISKVKDNSTIEKLNKVFHSYNGVRSEWTLIEKPPATIDLKTDYKTKYSKCAHRDILNCNVEFNNCTIAACFCQQVLANDQII